jgi:acylphosphatase
MTQHCSRHYIVRGRVQGVFYRRASKNEAVRLGINGWVRNLPDGSVEAYAIGECHAVAEFERWLAQGPTNANVAMVDAHDADVERFSEFTVR